MSANFKFQLQTLADRFGGASQLADIAGVKRSTFYGWLNGRDPRRAELAKIVSVTGCDPSALLGFETELFPRKGQLDHGAMEKGTDMISIPRFKVEPAGGDGEATRAFQNPEESFYVARTWLNRLVPPSVQVSMIEASWDSMEPTIRDGDVLLLRHDRRTPESIIGNVVILTLDNILHIKRVQTGERGELLLSSDNEFYTPISVPLQEWDCRAHVHGLAFWHGGPIRKR